MLFSSLIFLFFFLPAVIFTYFLSPVKWKNLILFLASILFYAWGEPKYVVLLLLTIIAGYFAGKEIEKRRESFWAKTILIIYVVLCAGTFVFFKYTDLLIDSVNKVIGSNLPFLAIALPIGISFYTFQMLSYVIDVYFERVKAQHSFINLGTYVAMFPQLIAGPIVRYSDIEKQLSYREHSVEKIIRGIRRFVIGLSKKVLLADVLGGFCEIFKTSEEQSVLLYWMYGIAFTLQIYYDFSGYSDMAIGLGSIFGFDFPENFRYPYISKSVTEFWRRWHISLGSWFRDYIYIPLGGNRVSKIKWVRNIFIVWIFTGLWHGAAWNFALWGLLFGFVLLIEKQWLYKYLEKCKVLNHVYVMLIVVISFVIFNASDVSEAFLYLRSMFCLGKLPAITTVSRYYLKSYGVTILCGVIGATPWSVWVRKKWKEICAKGKSAEVITTKNVVWGKVLFIAEQIMLVGLFLASVAFLVDDSFQPFLYFRF